MWSKAGAHQATLITAILGWRKLIFDHLMLPRASRLDQTNTEGYGTIFHCLAFPLHRDQRECEGILCWVTSEPSYSGGDLLPTKFIISSHSEQAPLHLIPVTSI